MKKSEAKKKDLKKFMLLKKEEGGNTSLLRVLELDEEKVLVMDCIKKTMPIWVRYEDLEGYEKEKCAKENENNFMNEEISNIDESSKEKSLNLYGECNPFVMLDDLSANDKKIALQRYNMVSGIIPFLSNESMRSEAIAKVAETYGKSKQSIRIYLCEYLSSMDIKSLAPKRQKEERPLNQDEKNMRKALNKWYYTTKKRTLTQVYHLMLQNFYCNENGKLKEEYPSFYQFRYFFRKYNKKETEYISRNGLSYYQRNQRPLIGDNIQAFAPNVGVGMLDSTILDIYLINEEGGIVGRPIMAACVDTFSSLCCGYSLVWEGGIYSLRDMMLNVVSNKVEHCKAYGIEIEENEWPCHQLPLKLVTDCGSEYKGLNFSQIVDLGVELVNLPSYRPELKGMVEKFFDCIQGYFKKELKGKGVIEPDFQERGVHDYRKDACLTMKQFETILLHCIIYYNTQRIVENFPYSEEMLAMDIKPYANELWNYGCGQIGCGLLDISKEKILLTLLPRTKGRFTRHGLSVNGLHYHNDLYREQYLQGKECVVAYDVDSINHVWLMEGGSYICFDLIENRFKDKDLEGVDSMKHKQKELIKKEREANTQAKIDLSRHIHVIANMSQKSTSSIKNIRDNRKKEIDKTHKEMVREVIKNE